jgi:hypothetical protein
MNMKTCVATVALLGSALALSLPVLAADSAGGAAPAGQEKSAAAKPVTAADCAKLTDLKAKDDCMKKAQATAGATTGATTGTTTGSTTKPATGGASKY